MRSHPVGPDQLTRLLGAWLASDVRALLLYDAPAWLVEQAALAVLAACSGRAARTWLGTWIDDDELWGTLEDTPFATTGLLLPRRGVDQHVLTVADLTGISLSLARAMVVAVEAETLRVERVGRSLEVPNRLRWLVACPARDVGRVSPHLLDRLPLRVRVQARKEEREAALRGELAGRPGEVLALERPLADPAPLGPGAAARAVEVWAGQPGAGVRRELGLLRLASGVARLRGAAHLEPAHVDEAAALLGLEWAPVAPAAPEPLPPDPDRAPTTPRTSPDRPPSTVREVEPRSGPSVTVEPPAETLPPVVAAEPLPEARAAAEREPDPLRLPHDRRGAGERGRGPLVGAQPARGTADLHLPATLRAAAPLQRFRRHRLGAEAPDHLLVYREDLRERRRLPVADDLFLFCIDHTARAGVRWVTGLAPFFHLAYTRRARVGVVSVGAAGDASTSLRATAVFGRSLLVPRVDRALEAPPGTATPLAHGLDLCRHVLTHALGAGRDTARRATLVVLTDGRGNVPLRNSLDQVPPEHVGRQGIDDALAAAARLRALRKVDMVVLDPRPRWLADLPARLADAMGARLVGLTREDADG